ncbi:UPF0104 family protein [Paludibacter sp. 221]|uniref:lysylphosphatidylglycerol synthase transmembrane domain-containing protein n=1 Tax=Paludibacter sp. 221 TaxID=2302939 RepID=UPI0013D6FBA8|nr:lysylphosphatidylglycerol synthase transmembrane domain-containing protein [Paludibacter sp. 221]NDV47744.1 UPF0104 family protein [Paludibacter sp. 221]
MPQTLESKPKQFSFKMYQILIPVVLGTGVIVWLFLREFDLASFKEIQFSGRSVFFIFVACLLMMSRDFFMMTRFRLMTNNELSWKQAFNINILREFAFAIMPAAIGAGPTVLILLNREGINAGRSTTISMMNLFFDNLFYVLVCPIIFLFIPLGELFNSTNAVASTIEVVFWTVYPLLCLWTLVLFLGMFVRPDIVARLLRYVFRLKFLKRWQGAIFEFTDNMIDASKEIKQRPAFFWAKVFAVTALCWSSRFLVANALFTAFTHVGDQLVIFGRQIIIWLAMGVSPTPGGSGLSELAFKGIYNDLMLSGSAVLVITAIWRIISYYVYLFAGMVVFPRWARTRFQKKEKTAVAEAEA